MIHKTEILTAEQITGFFEHGYIHLEQAIAPELAESCAQAMLRYMGIDEHNPAQWRDVLQRGNHRFAAEEEEKRYLYAEHAPRLWAAMGDLLGGTERIIEGKCFRDRGVATIADPDILEADDPVSHFQPPTQKKGGWHVDGQSCWFLPYLDSPEVGLLIIILFRDAEKLNGATWFAPQSPPLMSRWYAANPYGQRPKNSEIMAQCSDLRTANGKAGDAFLLHPFMMHSKSMSVLPKLRLMENDNVTLREPMRFDRESWEAHSIVEQSILRHLGVERLSFVRQGE